MRGVSGLKDDLIKQARDVLTSTSEDPMLPAKAKRTLLQLALALDVLQHRQHELGYMLLQLKATDARYVDADLLAAWRDRLIAAGFPAL